MTPETKLWQSVVLRAILDAYGNERKERVNADAWLRYGGHDFRDVCAMAGMDQVFIRQAYVTGRINVDILKGGFADAKDREAL